MTTNEKNARFRAMDLFLILLVLLAVVGIARRAGAFSANAADVQADYAVVGTWLDVDARTVDCLHVGDLLYTNAGELFGEVIVLTRRPHSAVWHEQGRQYTVTYPDGTREDVTVTVRLRGGMRDGVLLRESGRAVLIGETYRLYSQNASVALTVSSLAPS